MPLAPPPAARTLPELLARQAAARGEATALQTAEGAIPYARLAELADSAAARLAYEWKVRAGDRVAWLGGNHAGQLVLLFALARLGAILLPLNFRLAPGEWDALIADCGPVRVLHDGTWAQAAGELAARHGIEANPVEALLAPCSAPAAPANDAPQAPVLLVYTSGTTGGPKAAVHTQANLLANMAIAAHVQGMTPADTVLTVLPLFHVGGLCIQTLPALHAGARVVLHARFAPDETLAAIASERPTLTLLVPAVMKALIDHPRWTEADLSCLRAVWAGSSLLPAPLLEAFHARGVPVCNVYGATETGPFSIALPPAHARTHVGSCGWPAPGVEARLAHLHGDAGEVWLRGPNVVQRYWPDAPACDDEGWFHTGDLATQAADGSYTIVGRAKDLIISGGENIHPVEIENVLSQHPAVAECAAFGAPDAQWGEAVAVAVVLRAGAQADEPALRAHLEGRLARYKLPRRWVFIDALPKTALGKVQRNRLAQLL